MPRQKKGAPLRRRSRFPSTRSGNAGGSETGACGEPVWLGSTGAAWAVGGLADCLRWRGIRHPPARDVNRGTGDGQSDAATTEEFALSASRTIVKAQCARRLKSLEHSYQRESFSSTRRPGSPPLRRRCGSPGSSANPSTRDDRTRIAGPAAERTQAAGIHRDFAVPDAGADHLEFV